jgi:TonB family protein
MPQRGIAGHNGLFILLVLVIFPHPAMAQYESASCQELMEIPPPTQHAPTSPVGISVEVPPLGPDSVTFGPYLRRFTASIKHNLLLRLPESVANGGEGTVKILVRMQKDGSLSKDGLSIACSSGIKDFDAAAQSAIQNAAFERLPEGRGGSDFVLLFRITYRYVRSNPSNPSRRT